MEDIQASANITHPLPLDDEIAKGVAIWGDVTDEKLEELAEQMRGAFDDLRADETKQYGSCIAFAVKMSPVDEARVDEVLVGTADEVNHGIQTLGVDMHVEAVDYQLRAIWTGESKKPDRLIALRKFVGYVGMRDETIQEGIVYTLCARNPKDSENG